MSSLISYIPFKANKCSYFYAKKWEGVLEKNGKDDIISPSSQAGGGERKIVNKRE